MPRGYALAILLLAGARAVVGQQPAQAPTQTSAQASSPSHGLHWVTVKFDYDFTKTPPCAPKKPKMPCVQQFAIYDISNMRNSTDLRHRYFLFNVSLPPNPKGFVPGITFRYPQQIDMESGQHKLGVTAQYPNGTESSMFPCASCTTWVNVAPLPTPPPPSNP